MTTIRGEGQLQHHFWGTYHATIAIAFQDPESARDVMGRLPGFTPGKDPRVLVFHGNGEDFERAKAAIERHRVPFTLRRGATYWGNDAPIDSVEKSIDLGPLFAILVEIVPAEQTSFAFG